MKILSAKFANSERSAVEVHAIEAGTVLIALDGPDVSGGWREVYSCWAQANETTGYINPIRNRTAAEHFAAFGFDAIALLNLSDMERKFAAMAMELPPKCGATRTWINAVQVAYAFGQTPPDAPFTFSELLGEILPLLQS